MATRIGLVILLAMIISTTHTAPISVVTADYSAIINISTNSSKAIILDMSGMHSELGGSIYRWDNPELTDRVNQYDGFGYVRINGTNLTAYDWKTGSYGEEALGQIQSDDKSFYGYSDYGRIIETKGGETLEDLNDFLQRTGSKVIIPVNVFTNTTEQIGDLAKYCYDNHIPVLYFELGNEVSLYTSESKYNRSQRFKTGTDYLNRMKEFNNQIKTKYPGAKTVVSMDNTRKSVFNQDFKTEAFWDAITFHRFAGDGPNISMAMQHANNGLNGWDDLILHFLDNSKLSTRIEIGEHSTELNGILSLTHYNGIVIAENMLRLSGYPGVDHMQSWRIATGIGYPKNDYRDKILDLYQKNEKIDTNTLAFDFYDKAPAVSARVVDGALNYSTAAWTTSVTGGTTVETLKNTSPGTVPGTMPALYAQAYRGINARNYVVIVNKSDKAHNVTIKIDDQDVNQTMEMTYVTADPNSKNSAESEPVYLQTATITSSSVHIPEYSVTRLEWGRSSGLDVPPEPWLSYADASNNAVDLKWQQSVNATGYKIRYGTEPNNLIKEIDVGNVTAYTVTSLESGAAYYFAVAAYNPAGTSAYSNVNPSNRVKVRLTAPDAPRITNSHYEKSGRAVIEWESVSGVSGYVLKYGTASGRYTNSIDVGNNVGKIVDGLTNGKRYYFSVSAYNGIGESLNSSEVSVIPSADVPLAPHDLAITDETETSISLSWLNTRAPRESAYFENGNTNWNNVSGEWTIVNHPDAERKTKVYKSPPTGTALTIFDNASFGDLEGEARIKVGSFGADTRTGIVARYTDKDNYYMFVFDSKLNKYRLIKRQLGKLTVLSEAARKTELTDFILSLEVNGNQIIPRVNGEKIYYNPIVDSANPLSGGIFGLITINQEAFFDEVRLRKEIGTVNIYRSTDPLINFTLRARGIEGNTWSEGGLDPEQSYYYRVTSIYSGNESYDHSNTILKD